MDFIEGLPTSNGFEIIMVVVDRLSKYAHFIPLKHPYSAKTVATTIMSNVVKLHGFPRSIVSDRDHVFMSSFWKELFKLQGATLKVSSSYHLQTDGQTELVNQTLEQYLRCYCHEDQAKWSDYISWAEYWSNTSHHASINMTPFHLVYGRPLPNLLLYEVGSMRNVELEQEMISRDEALAKAKRELKRAQD